MRGRRRARVLGERRLALVERLHERIMRTIAPRVAAALLRVEADVGEAERLTRVARVVGQEDRAERAGDREALAVLDERGGGSVEHGGRLVDGAPR